MQIDFSKQTAKYKELRKVVFKRDPNVCARCGSTYKRNLEIDHIKPKSKYPDLFLDVENMQILCKKCNSNKGNRNEKNYRRTYQYRKAQIQLIIGVGADFKLFQHYHIIDKVKELTGDDLAHSWLLMQKYHIGQRRYEATIPRSDIDEIEYVIRENYPLIEYGQIPKIDDDPLDMFNLLVERVEQLALKLKGGE